MKARPHQIEALDTVWTAMQTEKAVLLQAPCSFGKTFIIAKICQKLLSVLPSARILILMDREILVEQTRDKIQVACPELFMDIGVVCSSIQKLDAMSFEKRILIASRQSLINQLDKLMKTHLIVIDECHLLRTPHKERKPDQFGQIINFLKGYNPKLTLFGVTATPYRLSEGYIYGDRHPPGFEPYFKDLHYKGSVKRLEAEGFLAPLIGETINIQSLQTRLESIPLVGGEYNIDLLGKLMSEGIYINAAVELWQSKAKDRKKTLAFCVNIDHAEKLAEAFNKAGIKAVAIHSEQETFDQVQAIEELNKPNSEYKVFCSVAKLTTGVDVPEIDCLLIVRSTKSASLHVQMIGRVQRIAEGKNDGLVLDMVGNCHEFGKDLDKVKVKYKTQAEQQEKKNVKICPQCDNEVHVATRFCVHCNYEFAKSKEEQTTAPEMMNVEFNKPDPPLTVEVDSMYVMEHINKKNKKKTLRIKFDYPSIATYMKSISSYLCFEKDGYSSFAALKGRNLWAILTDNEIPCPASVDEALLLKKHIYKPKQLLVDFNGEYPEIKKFIYEEIPF